ncbi:hypothetical protein HAX54_051295, partial [Datura stramonium]|nr:hypothetical protein [Datura stramonium]
MTGRVKTRLEPGGGAVEDWRSGGRMTSDDSGRLDGCSAGPEARAMADRWGVGEMGVPTAMDGRRRGDVAAG